MRVYVFGNRELSCDSLPLRILPELERCFPDMRFEIKDPHEEWGDVEKLIVIDTVHGIEKVKAFSDPDEFANSPRVTMHDFDALSNLKLLKKLGKIAEIKIIGLPPTISEKEALEGVSVMLRST